MTPGFDRYYFPNFDVDDVGDWLLFSFVKSCLSPFVPLLKW